MNPDIKKIRKEKSRLQRLEKAIGRYRVLSNDLENHAKSHIRLAIEELHKAEFDLIRMDF